VTVTFCDLQLHRGTPFGDEAVTDSIERAELESVFDVWERKLSDYIDMKGEYIT
jgi:hypothetical protein